MFSAVIIFTILGKTANNGTITAIYGTFLVVHENVSYVQ